MESTEELSPPAEKVNGIKRETREEKRQRLLNEHFDEIQNLRGFEFDYISANVYRESLSGANVSLPKFENQILDDQEIGAKYGPGKYLVVYRWKNDDSEKWGRKEIRYNIGAEFDHIHREYCKDSGQPCYLDARTNIPGNLPPPQQMNFLELLQREKIESLAALAALIRKLFERPESGESKNMMELFKVMVPAMLSNNKPAGNNDQLLNLLVTKAIDAPKVDPLTQMREMLALTGELKEIAQVEATPAQIQEKEPDKVDKLIELAVNMLPGLVEKFGGSIEAAAAAQKSNPLVNSYTKNGEKIKQAFNLICAKYGREYALRWVAGFGLDPAQFGGSTPQVRTIQAENLQAKQARVIEL